MGDDGMSSDSAERQIDAQGHRLAASVFEQPDSDTAVLVNAATGVPRQFYKYFATYLRDHGWTAVTWDYRGIGGSAPRTLRGFDVRMRDWALVDMPTVIDWLCTPATEHNTSTAPSRTRRLRSTSIVKSTCPGVSMMLMW